MKKSKYIDHTLLKADATKERIEKLCEEALTYDFASVCVNSGWVKYCAEKLKGSDVMVCTVVGFPLGAMLTRAKAYETTCAIEDGAKEIDMVINISALKDKNYNLVLEDIKAVVKAAQGNCVKVIFETCLLTEEEIIKVCELCIEAKATFVKTSTGFSTRGATVEDIEIMKRAVQDRILIKAAGGVRSMADMDAMIKAGANRIGCSAGVSLMQE